MIQIDYSNTFQMGWNHQLEYIHTYWVILYYLHRSESRWRNPQKVYE